MTKRLITKQQEKILRLCHHDFLGLSRKEAAQRLNVSQSTISTALNCIKKVLPHMFPILTKLEAERYHLYMIEGWSIDEIAEYFGVTPNSIYKALERAKNKGMYFTEAKGRILSYNPILHDHQVKQKF